MSFTTAPPPKPRQPWTRAIATVGIGAVIGVLITLLRLPRPTWDTLYAEDGSVFLQAWIADPSILLLGTAYDGYLHAWPRIVTGLVSVLPAAAWPAGMIVGFGVSVGAIGALSMIASKEVIANPTLRILIFLIPVLLPFAGVEALGNLANIHWYFLYLGFWCSWISPLSWTGAVTWGGSPSHLRPDGDPAGTTRTPARSPGVAWGDPRVGPIGRLDNWVRRPGPQLSLF